MTTLSNFQAGLAHCFTGLWWLSWQAAMLCGMVLLSQWLFRRWLTAQWRYRLWLLVVARVLLPFSLGSSLSVFNVVRREASPRLGPVPVVQQGTATPPPTTMVAPAPVRSSPVAEPASAAPAGRPPDQRAAPASAKPTFQSLPASALDPASSQRRALPRRSLNGWAVAAWGWLAGVTFFLAYVGWTSQRFLRRIRAARPLDDPAVLVLLDECRRQMKVRATVTLHETPLVKSPALCGMIRPRLLLPPDMTRRFSPGELRYVFLHELAHVKRRDVAMNWLLTLLQAWHWFNPVLWFGLARMRADRELACDALALACSSEEEARTYGLTIIKLLEGFTRTSPAPGLVGVVENPRQMKRRIQLIAAFRRNRRWSWLAAGLMAALAVTGLTDAVRSSRAQGAPANQSAPLAKEEGVLLRLTVLDAQTSQPIAGAQVVPGYAPGVTFSQRPPALLTDANGVAVISGEGTFERGACCGVFSANYAPRMLTTYSSSEQPKQAAPREYTVRLERGLPIGGVLRDEAGQPLAGVRVTVKGHQNAQSFGRPMPPIQSQPCYEPFFAPKLVTDQAGRWSCDHFAAGLDLQIDFEREDGALARFHAPRRKWDTGLGGETIDTEPAWRGELVCVFRRGVDVRARVVDAAGQPLAGVKVTETDGRHGAEPVTISETMADGRLVWPGRDPHQVLLTLTGPNLAPRVQTVNIAPDLPEMSLVMHPGVPLRLRVLDTNGQPVGKAVVRSTVRTLPWEAATDAAGRVAWEQAPVEPTAYQVEAADYGPRRVPFAATGEEQTITLRRGDPPGVLVNLQGLDAARRPLASFTVTAAYQTNGGMADEYKRLEPLGQGKDGRATVVVPTESNQSMAFRLKVEAPGRQPFISEPVSPDPRDMELTAVLPDALPEAGAVNGPGGTGEDHARIVLRLPDGKPAASASVVLNETVLGRESYISLWFPGRGRPQAEGEHKKTVVADTAGNVALPVGAADAPAFVLHENGYLFTTLGRLRQRTETTLDAWGRVEGGYTINGRSTADQRLHLQPHYEDGVVRVSYQLSAETDREGRFVFSQVPAGAYTLTRTKVSNGEWPSSQPTDLAVKAGQTTQLAYALTGRTVDGILRLDPPDAEIDWQKDVGDCLLVAQATGKTALVSNRPAYEDFVQHEDYQQADAAFLKAHRFAERGERQDTFAPAIDANGRFHFEGVPPGTYEFRLELRKSTLVDHQWQHQPLGSFKQTVFVPSPPPERNDLALDLGTLKVGVDAAAVPRRPLVELTARTLDGAPVQLADHRGKPVLLVFWASWAPPTPSEIENWRDTLRASGQRLVLLTANVDDDPVKARQFAQDHPLPGTSARLEGRARAAATESLGVDELPAVFLVGPDGRLMARRLSGPPLRAAVETILNANP